jgi:hypothetical protein
MDWFAICAFLYMHFFMNVIWLYYRDSIDDILNQKEHICKNIVRKKLTKKKLWAFEWPK